MSGQATAVASKDPLPHRWLESVVACLLFWGLLEYSNPQHMLHGDAHEDLFRATQCLAGKPCSGASTSLPGISQSGLWVRILSWLRATGMGVEAIHSTFMLTAAIGIGLLYRSFRWYWRPGSAAVGAGFCSALLVYSELLHVLWNPALMPAVVLLAFPVFLWHHREPSRRSFVWLAIMTGAAVSTHPAVALVIPFVCLGVGMGANTRWRALTLMLAQLIAIFVVYGILSPFAAKENWLTVLASLGVSGTVGGCLLGAIVWLGWSRLTRDMTIPVQRVAWCVLTAGAIAGVGLTMAVLRDRPELIELRYIFPAVAPAGFVIAALFNRLVPPSLSAQWLGAVIIMVLSATAAHEKRSARLESTAGVGMSLENFDQIMPALIEFGVGRDIMWQSLGGAGCHLFQEAAKVLELPLSGQVKPADNELFYLLAIRPGDEIDAWPGTWTKLGATGFAVGRSAGYLRRDQVTMCHHQRTGSDVRCRRINLREGLLKTARKDCVGPDATASGLSLSPAKKTTTTEGPVSPQGASAHVGYRTTYEMEVTIPAHGDDRLLYLVPGGYNLNDTYRFVSQGTLKPSASPHMLHLRGSTVEQQFAVLVEQPSEPGAASATLLPPCVIEVPANTDPHWLRRMGPL